MSNLESITSAVQKLKNNGIITKYQCKGMLLELAVYFGLIDIGIYPIPLHNPFDSDYARDQHLSVDLIFRYSGLTYAVECKNINRKWQWSKEWVKKEVVSRFDYLSKTVPVDVKVVVCSYTPYNLPDDYSALSLAVETTLNNIYDVKLLVSKLFLSLFYQIKPNNTDTVHGHLISRDYRTKELIKLKRIDDKLKREYEEKQIEGWIDG